MQEFFFDNYEWIRALHIISFIAWMAGLFYLPRLFVYHTMVEVGSDQSEFFKTMEQKLLKIIMTPAMVASWVFGLLLIWANTTLLQHGWMIAKLVAVLLLTAFHHVLMIYVAKFDADRNNRSENFYRIINEVPTVLMIFIVIMAVIEPF